MSNFIDMIQENFRIITTRMVFDDGEVIENDNVMSITRSFNAELFKSCMTYVKASIRSSKDFKNRSFSFQIGVKTTLNDFILEALQPYVNSSGGYIVPGAYLIIEENALKFNDGNHVFAIDNHNGLTANTKEDVNFVYFQFQTYYVDNDTIEIDIESKETSFTAYDNISKFAIDYEPLEIEYPCTVSQLNQAICNRVGVICSQTTFTNSEQMIEGELFSNQNYTYRDVINEIGGVSGTIPCINFNNELIYHVPTEVDIRITPEHITSLSLSDKFGPVNSIVLSLMPQEDNYYKKDDLSIENNGLCEVKIANNAIMQGAREAFIDGLYEALNGLIFYPFRSDNTYGYCVFLPGDLVKLVDLENNEKIGIIMNSEIEINGSITETIYAELPESYETNYNKATSSKKELYRTILEVDKQKGIITGMVADVDETKGSVSLVQQTASSLTIRINTVEEGLENTLSEDDIQKLIDQGISDIQGIKTLTGEFNDNGLVFDRSTNQLESTYSEDGMQIRDKEQNANVLKADHEGVDAINLTAHQYLIIGNNSRFEDYNGGTGCFFIGGYNNGNV